MSGPVRLDRISRRYWEVIPAEERADIEAAIPDGHVLYIYPGHRATPGTMTVSLRVRVDDYGAPTWRSVRDVRGRLSARLCRAALAGEIVTTDAAGYVVAIEEAV